MDTTPPEVETPKVPEASKDKEATKEDENKVATKGEKMDTSTAEEGEKGSESKEKKSVQIETEPDFQMLSNPARVLPQQVCFSINVQ